VVVLARKTTDRNGTYETCHCQTGGGLKLEITEVVIRLIDDERLKAYVSLTIEDALVIKDIKIVDGKNGLFVSMPSRRKKNGKYQDIAHPINTDFRKKMEDKIFEEYRNVVGDEDDYVEQRTLEANLGSDGMADNY
jgi:stage V sporulation protein G